MLGSAGEQTSCRVRSLEMKLQHVTVGSGSTLGGSDAVISDAVRLGDLVFLSGRAPIDPSTLELVGEGFEEQVVAVLGDIGAVLEAAGSDWDHVLRVECFLADAGDFPAWNRIWSERFKAPRPARTTVVTEFVIPGMRIELEVTAAATGAGA
jgi:2-iminobutanoate/2-iminopropanoate deaminase